jgi:two-component system LytT family sensor kinase
MKLKDLQKGEFWVATILYVFAVIILISDTNGRSEYYRHYEFQQEHIEFSYFSSYFIPTLFRYSILYLSFLLLNFVIVPPLIQKKNELLNYSIIAILIVFIGTVTSICNTYSEAYKLVQFDTLQQAYNRIFFDGYSYAFWLVIVVSGYVLLKEFAVYLIENKNRNLQKPNQIKIDIGIGLAFWFVGLLFWLTTRAPFEIMAVWSLVIFATIGVVVYSIYYLLPLLTAKQRKFKSYFLQLFLISLLLGIPMSLIGLFFFNDREEFAAVTFLFHLGTQLIISAPLSWFVYKRRMEDTNEITSLRTELGRSDASLSFLQSQINPHFLFNALNTLYGTALQENAERTGEGIQKLGDMMRFMLHENVQDKISLTRDVDYLENYISLQKLRTSRSSDIVIETQIDEQLNNYQITPMLLIPFVENAFKHGISLQHPSHIKITLQTKEKTLYFDVHNSIHIKPDNDPEKLKSGIGLANVKQRLALLYPGKHELIIRESAKEFFIHLTIQL